MNMNYRTLCVIGAVVTLLFGLGFVIAPAVVLSLYGIATVDAPLALLTRYFGSTLVIYAAAIWSFREVTAVQIQRGAARLLAASQTLGLLVSLQGVLAGTVNALGWSSVLIYGFFVVAWARLGMARD
jgi:uncharacterized membrane protein